MRRRGRREVDLSRLCTYISTEPLASRYHGLCLRDNLGEALTSDDNDAASRWDEHAADSVSFFPDIREGGYIKTLGSRCHERHRIMQLGDIVHNIGLSVTTLRVLRWI
jgi:hypothetical protein